MKQHEVCAMRARYARQEDQMTELQYLASPYSHKDAWMRELRFRAVTRVAGALRRDRGLATFCPIAHSHPISKELTEVDPTDHEFWLSWDEPFERLCTGLIVCMLPGWDKSRGIATEVPLFEAAGKSIEHLPPRRYFTLTEWQMLEAAVVSL